MGGHFWLIYAYCNDDQMLRLMTDENALQSGGNSAAITNEVVSIAKRPVQMILPANRFAEKLAR
jgi:hypothetical protein